MTASRALVVKGCAGLGNRLMTLAWAIRYALGSGRTLAVDWADGIYAPKGRDPFPDHFFLRDVPYMGSLEEIGDLSGRTVYPEVFRHRPQASIYDLYEMAVPFPAWRRRCVKLLTGGRWKVTGTWALRREFRGEVGGALRIPCAGSVLTGRLLPLAGCYPADLKPDVVFGADFLPAVDAGILRRHLSFRPEFEARLKSIADGLGVGKSAVGIHVRQTDWGWQTDLDILLRRLRTLPRETRVFLATDSAAALERIREIFSSLIVYPKFLPAQETRALHTVAWESRDAALSGSIWEESLIDAFLLSRCGTFWYQGGSSFSTVARVWADPDQRAEDWSRFEETTTQFPTV